MPFYRVQPERLNYLSVFGYKIIYEDEYKILADTSDGHVFINKKNPIMQFDDPQEAMQFGALGLFIK